jgi:hypothetical protein
LLVFTAAATQLEIQYSLSGRARRGAALQGEAQRKKAEEVFKATDWENKEYIMNNESKSKHT